MFIDGVRTAAIAKSLGKSEKTIQNAIAYRGWKRPNPRKIPISENYFSSIDSSVKAYLLGFIAADGCVRERNRSKCSVEKTLCILLNKKDQSVVRILRDELSPGRPIHFAKVKSNKRKQRTVRCEFPSNKLCLDLAKYGVVPRKTKVFDWPSALPMKFRREFILGYFDGDGSFGIYEGRPCWSLLGNKPLLKKVRKIIKRKIGVESQLTYRKHCHIWNLRVRSRNDVIALDRWLHEDPTIGLRRKTAQGTGIKSLMYGKSYFTEDMYNEVKNASPFKWTKKKVQFLKDNYESMPYNDIASHFNVSLQVITKKLNKEGLTKINYWTPKEDAFLKKNCNNLSQLFISQKLNRSWHSIRCRASRLSLRKAS